MLRLPQKHLPARMSLKLSEGSYPEGSGESLSLATPIILQVQLVHSLAISRRKAVERSLTGKGVKKPLMEKMDVPPGKIMTPRQQRWTHSLPNDGITENPVFYR